jgi:hypothetical protein
MEVEITKTFDHLGTHYEAGARVHLANSIAVDFIHHGVAKRRQYKSTKEFMDAQEQQRQASLPQNNDAQVKWSVRRLSNESYIVCRLHFGETLYFDPKLYGADEKTFAQVLKNQNCPEATIHQWIALSRTVRNDAADAAALDQAKRAEANRQEREKGFRRW